MDGVTDTPGRDVVIRRWKYAAPPWRLYDALVGERDHWLLPWDDERTPAVTECVANERVVLAPWVNEEINDVTVVITTEGQGSKLTVVMHADHELSEDTRKAARYRLGTLFGEALRTWVDGW
jgi:hypothetical protein